MLHKPSRLLDVLIRFAQRLEQRHQLPQGQGKVLSMGGVDEIDGF